jgi:hypothetical protein
MGLSFRAQAQDLPEKEFEIRSGSVWMQGGLLGLRDKVMLFLTVGNGTGQTIWAEVEFRPPDTGTVLRDVGKINVRDTGTFRWPVATVSWDTEYPFTVSLYEDEQRQTLLRREKSVFFFEGGRDRESFEKLRAELPPGQASAINGFRDNPHEVPGTRARPMLQRDIARRLLMEASRLHEECQHMVVKAEPYEETRRSLIAAEMGEKGQALEKRLRAKGEMAVEKWFVKSCETVSAYEVLTIISPQGGTDIMVKRLDSAR